ncbi:MAG TPA: tetratricopeptide repeat protein, partial [Gammaproteobacteria bacterium]
MRSALPLLVVLSLAACASPRPPTAEQYSQAFDETSAKAATGDVVAERELGGMYFSGQGVPQDYAESADWYGKAAEGGDAQAQAQLGFAYEYGGRGVPKDAARGQALLLQAASQGLPIAESVAGYNFLSGTGTSADYGQAHVWLEKAAKAGEPSAATNLGSMYCRGDGVQKDEAACVSWYKQAAQLGSRPGQLLLADAYR